jgi:hypothetical protein
MYGTDFDDRSDLPQPTINPVVLAHWETWRDSDNRPMPHAVRDAYVEGWYAALKYAEARRASSSE